MASGNVDLAKEKIQIFARHALAWSKVAASRDSRVVIASIVATYLQLSQMTPCEQRSCRAQRRKSTWNESSHFLAEVVY